MYQDNKSQLIWCQLIHCVLFLFMGTLFAVMDAKTISDEGCEGRKCNFTKIGDHVPTDYSV